MYCWAPSMNHLAYNVDSKRFCLYLLLFHLERTEGDIEWRGPLPCPRPGHRGRGRGEVFQTLQWFSGKGRAFSNSSMVFGDGGKQNESMVFQCFPRLTPVAPVSFFLAFFKQKNTLMSWNLVFASSITTANCIVEAAVNVGHVRLIK